MFEKLYNLTEKDLTGVLASHVAEHNSASAAASNVNSPRYQVPADHNLWVSGLTMQAIPGAAQYLQWMTFRLYDEGGVYLCDLYGQGFDSTATKRDGASLNEELVIPALYQVEAHAYFNAGAVANTVELNVVGWLIPQGTLRR